MLLKQHVTKQKKNYNKKKREKEEAKRKEEEEREQKRLAEEAERKRLAEEAEKKRLEEEEEAAKKKEEEQKTEVEDAEKKDDGNSAEEKKPADDNDEMDTGAAAETSQESENPLLDIEDFSKLKVVELKEHLTNAGLDAKGKKAELVQRLEEHVEVLKSRDASAVEVPESKEVATEEKVEDRKGEEK